MFTMVMTTAEHEDMKVRAAAREISAAQYVREALAAVAAVGGPEEYGSRVASKRDRDVKKQKGKNK